MYYIKYVVQQKKRNNEIVDIKNRIWYNEYGIKFDNVEKNQIERYINSDNSLMKIGEEFVTCIGDYYYIGTKISDAEFRYFGKIEIDKNTNLIKSIARRYKNGVNKNTRDTYRLLKEHTNGRKQSNSNTFSSTNRTTNR